MAPIRFGTRPSIKSATLSGTSNSIDYVEDAGDLYIRFKNAETIEGEPTSDGKTITHYDKKVKIEAVEITDITSF